MRKLTIVLVLTSLTAIGCDDGAPKEDGRPTKVGSEEVPSVKDVKEAAKTAGPEDCKSYFKQVADTCRESIHEGLSVSCNTLFMKATVAHKQKSGELFKDPNEKVSADAIGNANCAVNIKSLARKRAKAETGPKVAWGSNCTAFFKQLDDKCLAPVAKGEFDEECTAGIMQIKMLQRNDNREELCKNLIAMLPK